MRRFLSRLSIRRSEPTVGVLGLQLGVFLFEASNLQLRFEGGNFRGLVGGHVRFQRGNNLLVLRDDFGGRYALLGDRHALLGNLRLERSDVLHHVIVKVLQDFGSCIFTRVANVNVGGG